MSVPWINQMPTHWQDYLPSPDDFATAEEFDAAMRAGAVDNTAPLAGGWVNSRAEREPEFAKNAVNNPVATERSAGVAKLNWLFNQPGNGQRNMLLQNYISNHPDIARAAYNAFDEAGNPLVDPAILAMIERQLGIGPQAVVSENPPSITVDPTHDPGFGTPEAGGSQPGFGPPEAGGVDTGFTPPEVAGSDPMGAQPQAMTSTFMPGVPDDVVLRIRQRYGRVGQPQRAGGLGPY